MPEPYPKMETPFAKLLARLADAGVQFVVVGGVAVALNGYVRLTEDVDILAEDSPSNLQRLLECLAGFGEGFARELSVSDFSDDEGAIRIVEETESCMIDIFTRMRGVKYAEVANDAISSEVNGRKFLHASRATLIRLKSGSAREKDILDIAALRQLEQNPRAFD